MITPTQPSLAHLTDDELIIRIDRGDVEEPLAELQRRHHTRIHTFVQSIVRDTHLADDIDQEVFAKVFFKCHLYRPGTNFRAWLFEIARNQALSALRARCNTPTPIGNLDLQREGLGSTSNILEDIPDRHEERHLEESEFMDAFSAAVEELSERYRSVFDLCVQQGVHYRDAATRLGIPNGTVAIRIMRARKRLYNELEQHLDRVRRPPACVQ